MTYTQSAGSHYMETYWLSFPLCLLISIFTVSHLPPFHAALAPVKLSICHACIVFFLKNWQRGIDNSSQYAGFFHFTASWRSWQRIIWQCINDRFVHEFVESKYFKSWRWGTLTVAERLKRYSLVLRHVALFRFKPKKLLENLHFSSLVCVCTKTNW